MSIEVKVPPLPESVADATLVTWHRKPGDAVRRDENLVDLETDKVVLEVPAPRDGILKEIRVADGATVTSGEILAILEPGDVPQAQSEQVEPSRSAETTSPDGVKASTVDGDIKLGPAARALLEEHDLDPAAIEGTGRDGRITKGDVMRHMAVHGDSDIGAEAGAAEPGEVAGEVDLGARAEQRVAMTRLRKRVAERLVEAQQTAAMLTTFNEVDMSAIIELRKRFQDEFVAKYGIKLGFMSFFVRASVAALREYPIINAAVDGTDILYREYFDIGIAVSTDRGLLVPVLRDVQRLGFAEIEKAIADVGARARAGEISIEELTGGTFSITNGGIFGSMLSTPILNPPQSGILGMHAIQQRAVVVDGQIVARPMMYVALTYDHRIIDGREAVQFLVALKQLLEDPSWLLLQI